MDERIEIRIIYNYKDHWQLWNIDDLNKLTVKDKYQGILNNLKENRTIVLACSVEGPFKGVEISDSDNLFQNPIYHNFYRKFIIQRNIKYVFRNDIIYALHFYEFIDNMYNYNKNENLKLENKYDKKFNELFENTSDIIKELKKDLDIKNEKIRELETKVHYLELQTDKKVKYNYNEIKQKNKLLNNEFKRVAKLMKL
jgi:hypothetical protein